MGHGRRKHLNIWGKHTGLFSAVICVTGLNFHFHRACSKRGGSSWDLLRRRRGWDIWRTNPYGDRAVSPYKLPTQLWGISFPPNSISSWLLLVCQDPEASMEAGTRGRSPWLCGCFKGDKPHPLVDWIGWLGAMMWGFARRRCVWRPCGLTAMPPHPEVEWLFLCLCHLPLINYLRGLPPQSWWTLPFN